MIKYCPFSISSPLFYTGDLDLRSTQVQGQDGKLSTYRNSFNELNKLGVRVLDI